MCVGLQMLWSLSTHLAQLWPLCHHPHNWYGFSSRAGIVLLHLKVMKDDKS